ncbi:hypothetical protein NUKP104_34820 [Klebsiella variicola]|nr:zinc-binding dehydrogenase [Klebsiella variicola]GKO29769.1 hypothetical protein NUKP104_34820 [Klebsiella variicola]
MPRAGGPAAVFCVPCGAQLARLADLLDAGVIRVAIDSVFPLAQAQMAHERAVQGRLQGKIVLSVMDSSAE